MLLFCRLCSYQSERVYQGTASDFKAGWAAVAAACKEIAPEVKMWWTPNVAAASSYQEYEPDDMSTVDLVGIDYYPKSTSQGNEFVTTMKAFHDKYAVNGRKFAIGETGYVKLSGNASLYSFILTINLAFLLDWAMRALRKTVFRG